MTEHMLLFSAIALILVSLAFWLREIHRSLRAFDLEIERARKAEEQGVRS